MHGASVILVSHRVHANRELIHCSQRRTHLYCNPCQFALIPDLYTLKSVISVGTWHYNNRHTKITCSHMSTRDQYFEEVA